jgi:hypothetical protein
MSAAYRCPVTRLDVEYVLVAWRAWENPVRKVSAAGLTPTCPTTEVVPVVDTADFARIAKDAAVPRFTAPGDVELLVVANGTPPPLPGTPPPPPPHPAARAAKTPATTHARKLNPFPFLVISLSSFVIGPTRRMPSVGALSTFPVE